MILDLEALEEVTESGECSAGERGRGLLCDRELDAVKHGGLGGLGDAVMLDV